MKTPIKKYAHLVGLLYLVIIFCGLFSEMFVRGSLIVPNDAEATFNNILNNLSLYRWGFVADLIMAVCDAAVAILFYQIFKHENKLAATITSFFRFGQAIIIAVNLLNYFVPVLLVTTGDYTPTAGNSILMYTNLHMYGYLTSAVFFGISCLFLGYLFIKSPYFPSLLGKMILIASIGYLADSFVNFLFPDSSAITELVVLVSAIIAELSLCLWLLIKGTKTNN